MIGEAELLKYIPFNDVRFFQVGHHILVTFDSLLRTKGERRDSLLLAEAHDRIDGEKKLVAFSKHAIDRMCDRIKTHWKMYGALGDLFGFLTYRNFPRKPGLTVEQSLAGLRPDCFAGIGIVIPEDLITDCVRLCCSLCLLENDPEIIAPDVLTDDGLNPSGSPQRKVRGQGPSAWEGGVGCWSARQSRAPLSPPAHDLGLDGSRAGRTSHCSQEGQRRPSGGRGKGAKFVAAIAVDRG